MNYINQCDIPSAAVLAEQLAGLLLGPTILGSLWQCAAEEETDV